SYTAGHAGGEIASGRAKHDDAPAGHVFAAMVAYGLNHRLHAAVAHAEAFAGHPANVSLAAGGAVQGDITNNNVFFRNKGGAFRREHDDFSAGQTLADIIVSVAFEEESHSFRHERAKTLARAAGEMDFDRVLRQPFSSPFARDFAADNRADDAIDIVD